MTIRDVAIRIGLIGGKEVEKGMQNIGEEADKAFKKVNDATKPANDNLKLINATVEEAKSKFEEFTEHAGAIGRVLAELGPIGAAAGAALGAFALVVHETVEEAEKFEQGQRRLEAVLRATGSAAGLTKKELTEFAEEYAHATLRSAEDVQQAEAELLTYKNVQGEVFKEAVKLASDAADTWKTDFTGAVRGLGKALNDPIDGIKGLTKAHIDLTAAEKENIIALAASGQRLEAQEAILEALRARFGGESEAQNTGVTGAAKQFKESLGELSRAIGQNIADTGILQSVLGGLADKFRSLRTEVRATSEEELAQLNERIERMQKSGTQFLVPGTNWENPRYTRLIQERSKVEEDIAKEEAEKRVARQKAEEETMRAHGEALAGIQDDIDQKLAEETQSERDKIIQETEEYKQRILAELAPDKSNQAQVNQEIALVERLRDIKLDKLDAQAAEEARRLAEANQRVIDTLRQRVQLEGITDPKQKTIQGEVDKLNASATSQQIALVKQLAAAYYDEKEAIEKTKQAQEAHTKAVEKINEEMKHFKSSYQIAKEGLDDWKNGLIKDLGGATAENQHYIDIINQIYTVKLRDIYYKSLEDSKNWEDGAISALHKYAEEATNTAKIANQVFTKAADDATDALSNLALNGKLDIGSIKSELLSLEHEALNGFFKKYVTGPGADWLGSLLGGGSGDAGGGSIFSSIFSSIFHKGGVVGESSSEGRDVPAWLFAGAPRFHSGLAPDEFPAILQKGETVLPKNSKAGGMNVTMNINTPNAQSFMESKGQVMAKFASEMRRYQVRNG